MNLSLIQKGLLVVTAPLVIEFALIAILWQQVSSTQEQAAQQLLSINRIKHAESLLHIASAVEFSVNDEFLEDAEHSALATSQQFFDHLREQTDSIAFEAQQLKALQKSPSTSELKEVLDIAVKIFQEISTMQNGISSKDAALKTRALKLGRSEFRKLTRKLYENLTVLVESENNSNAPIIEKAATADKSLKATLLMGMLVNVFVSGVVVVWFATNIGGRIRILVNNSIRLKEGIPLLLPLKGDDEVTSFDKAFRLMTTLLAEAHRREVAIIDNTADVIFTLDRLGNILKVSPSILTNWGFSADEVRGRNLSEFVETSQDPEIRHTINNLTKEEKINRFELRIINSDGSPIDLIWSCCYSTLDDVLVCIAHDITERKKYEQILAASEMRVAQMLNSMPIGAVVVNDNGIIEMVNPSCEIIFALKREALIGHSFNNLLTEKNTAAPLSWNELLESSNTKIAELFAVRSDQKRVPVEVLTAQCPTLDHLQYIVNLANVSDVKEKEQRRRAFVLNTSHELRSTLTSVHISLQLIATSGLIELTPEAAKVAQSAERNSTKLLKLIDDMLDSEKLESGMLDLVIQTHELNRIMLAAVDRLESSISEMEIKIDADGMGNFLVDVDADRIEQVFFNLIGNAVKFSTTGTCIHLKTEFACDSQYLKVLVEDQGRGIPDNFLKIVFLRFQQVYPEDRKQGSGFGLSICKGIVESHGGQIGVDSEVNVGSKFWFTIPLAATDADA